MAEEAHEYPEPRFYSREFKLEAVRLSETSEKTVAQIARDGGRALVLAADVTDKTQAQAAVARTVAELGRLDTLVNNAGVALLGPVESAPLDEWEQMVRVNVLGTLYMAHAALPHLLTAAADGPRYVADLVNVSSRLGRGASAYFGVYNITKFGEVAFSESLC